MREEHPKQEKSPGQRPCGVYRQPGVPRDRKNYQSLAATGRMVYSQRAGRGHVMERCSECGKGFRFYSKCSGEHEYMNEKVGHAQGTRPFFTDNIFPCFRTDRLPQNLSNYMLQLKCMTSSELKCLESQQRVGESRQVCNEVVTYSQINRLYCGNRYGISHLAPGRI